MDRMYNIVIGVIATQNTAHPESEEHDAAGRRENFISGKPNYGAGA